MKKALSNWLKAGILTATLSINSSSIVVNKNWTDLSQDFKEKISDIINYDEINKNYQNLDTIQEKKEITIFPKEIVSFWVKNLSNAILENIKYNGLNYINPPFVDIWWFSEVYCAWTMKWFLQSVKQIEDRSENENIYLNKIWVDAWELPDEFSKKWLYEQKIDLMPSFDVNKIWLQNIIKDKELYDSLILQTWKYLEENDPVWAMLFMYFQYSSYKDNVRQYNLPKIYSKQKLSINTHQAMYIWNSFMTFKAWEIWNIDNNTESEFVENTDIIQFVVDFIQKRSWFKWGYWNFTRDEIFKNLVNLKELVWIIEVNWKKIDFQKEYKKSYNQRIKIKSDDEIKFSWPILADWFHEYNTPNKFISQNNHLRTKFFFEFALIWPYTMSELMVPTKELIKNQTQNDQYDNIRNNIKIKHVYHLNKWETIELKLKESILRFDFNLGKLLDYSNKEIEILNKIQETFDESKKYQLNQELIDLRNQQIEWLIASLSKKDRQIFENNYRLQIKWLQLFWYLQNESKLNPWTTNINSPILFFDYEWLESNFLKYINLKKKEIEENQNIDLINDKEIDIYFFPGDNFWKIFTQFNNTLLKYSKIYPNFEKIDKLDLFQKIKLLDILIDKYSNNKKIDITRGKIPSYENIKLNLEHINTVLNWIINESYTFEVEINETDKIIIENITSTKQAFDTLAHVLVRESYENWVPLRKIWKEVKDIIWEISSRWDFQIRFDNLRNKKNALKLFPSVENLSYAISTLENKELSKLVERRKLRFEEHVESDLKIVEKIKDEIKFFEIYDDDRRLEAWVKIYEYLKELFRFNWEKQINIVWKIMQSALIQDKINWHYTHVHWWLERSNENIDNIIYDNSIQNRLRKLILIINNRWEIDALFWTLENYIIRILESKSISIDTPDYPQLEKNWSWQIVYWPETVTQRLNFYIKRLKTQSDKNNYEIELIQKLIEQNLSAQSIYKFFSDKNIKKDLESNWFDSSLLPTIEEYYWGKFRWLFFDYQKTPNWRKPPETYKKVIEEKVKYYWIIFLTFFAWFNLPRIKKYLTNKKLLWKK